ncbi:MAG: rRNA maturation RNAse YbeY, partial [Boseongicola sp.]
MSVDVIIEESRWRGVDIAALAEQAVSSTLIHLDLEPAAWHTAILATDDAKIAQLNLDYRGQDRATNVLSWPSVERGASNPGET